MIRISQMKMPLGHTKEELIDKAAHILHVGRQEILSFQMIKKSIDARKKPEIYFVYTIDLEIKNEEQILLRAAHHKNGKVQIQKAKESVYRFPLSGTERLLFSPVIIGTGPAGLFCGYFLSLYGYRPILLERGKEVTQRKKDVEAFWENGILQPDSNVQFGEGGAGTFSDGKLNTLVKDKFGRNKEVLRIFVHAGAPEEILYEAKPHIGTDMLVRVVENMRNEIIAHGGEVRFESKVTDIVIENSRVKEVIINGNNHLPANIVVLAVGHSARDTFQMLYGRHVPMDAKSFAVGLRIEHPRKMINRIQYGLEEHSALSAADYKVTAQTSGGRGIYSFCMCPGGYVVNASSEAGKLAINGMSYSGRGGANSNSAIIMTVTPKDFENAHPLAGISFQRSLEQKAYEIGRGKVPVETYGNFRKSITGIAPQPSGIIRKYPDFMPAVKGAYEFSPVHEILPKHLQQAFVEGITCFDKMLPGFGDSGAYVSGVESRTSSPVRIHRDETGQSEVRGLYPCGEGAGYAGGITSAAMDGMLIAEKIAEKYTND